MEKFIPYEKLSKKEKRKLDNARRQTWGELNPVTRKPASSKAYNRNKARDWKREHHETSLGSCSYFMGWPFIRSTNSVSFAVISTQAGRKPLRMAFRTDLMLHHAAQ